VEYDGIFILGTNPAHIIDPIKFLLHWIVGTHPRAVTRIEYIREHSAEGKISTKGDKIT
jgi:hypothetical protein